MKKLDILSKRKYAKWPSWHLVYEWENVFSSILEIPIHSSRLYEYSSDNKYVRDYFSTNRIKKIAQYINRLFESKKKSIVFELSFKHNFSYSNGVNSIPIIIDFYSRDVDRFIDTYKNCKLICISSLEVYNFLKDNNCPLNIKHLPLSLSDIYKIDPAKPHVKKYDFLLAGRKNAILWNFLLEYEKKFPQIEYLYQEEIDGKLYYKSNKTGLIGNFHTRSEYINLLNQSKIAFYSTPGIDGGLERTQGFDQVTPRYLELIAAGCYLMGRYPINVETEFYELEVNCPHVESYEQFEELASLYLASKGPDLLKSEAFLNKHYTSNRALLLKKYIEETF